MDIKSKARARMEKYEEWRKRRGESEKGEEVKDMNRKREGKGMDKHEHGGR